MIRKISFTDEGNIRVETDTETTIISHGVVLLTKEQAQEAKQHGWQDWVTPPSATVPPLYAVRRV